MSNSRVRSPESAVAAVAALVLVAVVVSMVFGAEDLVVLSVAGVGCAVLGSAAALALRVERRRARRALSDIEARRRM